MKSIMKTALRNTKLVMILAFLPALLSAAQAQAVDYKSTYKGVRYEQPYQHAEYKVASTASAPTVGFQSTSAYSSQFGSEEQSMLNSDGTVNAEVYGVGAKNASGLKKSNTPPPPGQQDPKDRLPLGDVVWPLMLLLCAYAGYKKVRARKEA